MELRKSECNTEITVKTAVSSKRIMLLTDEEIKKLCHSIIYNSFVFCGFKGSENEDTVTFQTLQLISLLKKDFKHFGTQEIELAFKYGVRNKFGQFMGLNPRTYFQFLSGYESLEERIEAKQKELIVSSEPVLSKEQKDEILLSFARRYFEEYKLTKTAHYHFHYVLDFLTQLYGKEVNGKKTLIVDEQKRKEIKQTALNEYERYVLSAADTYKQQGMNRKAKEVASVLNDLKENHTYINYQKKNAVKCFFDEQIENGNNMY
jgi:hypothetical protein